MLFPLDFAFSEFGPQPDLSGLLSRYLPPGICLSVLFMASSVASSTPKKTVTFVQAFFLLGTTFIVCSILSLPIQHFKADMPPTNPWTCIPFLAVPCVFLAIVALGYSGRTSVGPQTQTIVNSDTKKYDVQPSDGLRRN